MVLADRGRLGHDRGKRPTRVDDLCPTRTTDAAGGVVKDTQSQLDELNASIGCGVVILAFFLASLMIFITKLLSWLGTTPSEIWRQ